MDVAVENKPLKYLVNEYSNEAIAVYGCSDGAGLAVLFDAPDEEGQRKALKECVVDLNLDMFGVLFLINSYGTATATQD